MSAVMTFVRWLNGDPWPAVGCGRLAACGMRWAAVPGRRAIAFAAAHRGVLNAVSFAHVTRGMAARYPETAAAAERSAVEVAELEGRYPGCVLFVFAGFHLH